MTGLIGLAVLALVVFLVVARAVRIIPQSRVAIVQRFGRYHRTAESGLTLVVPIMDRMLPKTDLMEQVVAFQPQAAGMQHQVCFGSHFPDPCLSP